MRINGNRMLGMAAAMCVMLAGAAYGQGAAEITNVAGGVVFDPQKVVGSEKCAECHQKEIGAWKQTPHFATWDTLHRKPEARKIAEAMGVRSIKRGEVCIKCHYTRQGPDADAISGISCESCHGPARDWISIHNDYGGENVTKEQETAEHKKKRIRNAIGAGMLHPSTIYLVAQNCYNCHTVPNEKLVDVGGHAAGSQDFELVSWSQGMVRHNYLRTGGESNAQEPQEYLRVMYAVGVMTDVEYSLRGIAKATQANDYARTMAQRTHRMREHLKELHAASPNPHFATAIEAAYSAGLKLNNEAALTAAADKVGNAAMAFATEADGTKLEALDQWVPKLDQYKGTPAP